MKRINTKKKQVFFWTKQGNAGDAFEIGNKIPYLILIAVSLTIVLFIVSLTFNYYNSYKIEVPDETYANTYITRFLYSPTCFSASGQFYSATSSTFVIDYDTFTEEQLHSCYQSDQDARFSFRLTLQSDDGAIRRSIQTQHYVGQPQSTLRRYILVEHGDKLYDATLQIEIGY
jgi:hypothetical protein